MTLKRLAMVGMVVLIGFCAIGRSAPPAPDSRAIGDGQAHVDSLVATHADAIRDHLAGKSVAGWAEIAAEIDRAARQKDGWASGLHWFTDLDAAKAEAARTGRPILSLRLLGGLDVDLSCANSRLFRTTLYPNRVVSKLMRDRFVLHWSSERPVPIVTVDFGDGRTMRRTVTGNSAHYVLTPRGRPVDVLPGLYGARAFALWLEDAARLAADMAGFEDVPGLTDAQTHPVLADRHAVQQAEVQGTWTWMLARAGVRAPAVVGPHVGPPTAAQAGARAFSKSRIEAPLLRQLVPVTPLPAEDPAWANLADLAMADTHLDESSVALIRSKLPVAATPDEVTRVVLALRRSVALDTVKNEYALHSQVHAWFATATAPIEFEALNDRVYAELFLTPRADSWLGLAPADADAALDDGGLSTTARASP